VSRSIMERHHGRIEVQSELGKGTTFTLTLPLDAASMAEMAGAVAATTNAR